MSFKLPHICLPSVLAWCGGRPAGSIIALLFMTGLVGGFAHCGPMCGVFVMAQTAGDPASGRLESIKRGLLLPYHFGRTATYTVLGAAAAGLGNGIIAASSQQLAVSLLLAFAALMFIGQAVERLIPGMLLGGVEVLAAGLGCRLACLSRPLLGASLRSQPDCSRHRPALRVSLCRSCLSRGHRQRSSRCGGGPASHSEPCRALCWSVSGRRHRQPVARSRASSGRTPVPVKRGRPDGHGFFGPLLS
jgi:hypothetical protein